MTAPETLSRETIHHGGLPHLAEMRSRPWPWLVPLLGVLFVALVGVSIGLGSSAPASSAGGATVIGYYNSHKGQMTASGLLTALAIPVGLFFFVFLRQYLRGTPRARVFATVGLAGTIMFAAAGCVAAGLTFSLTDVPGRLSPGAAQALNVLAADANAAFLIGGLSTMQFGFGAAILAGRLMPRWLGWLSILIGVVSLLGPLAFFGLMATGLWTLIVSALLYPRLVAGPALLDD